MANFIINNGLYHLWNKTKEYIKEQDGSVAHYILELKVADWENFEQTLEVPEIRFDDTIMIIPDYYHTNECKRCHINAISQDKNSITFQCYHVPMFAVTLNVFVYDTTPVCKHFIMDLDKDNWINFQQIMPIPGVDDASAIMITPETEDIKMWHKCGCYASAQANDQITFTCRFVPTTDMTLNIIVYNSKPIDLRE